MVTLCALLRRSRTVRPLLWWVLAVLAYVVVQPPQGWVLLLIIGLGVALTVTVGRVREATGGAMDNAGRVWQLAERLAGAVEDRIRGDQDTPTPLYAPQAVYGQVRAAPPVYGHVGSPVVAYDPGALLSSIVAVLAAEGLATDPAPALPAALHLLTDLGIQPQPGIPAPTAYGLLEALTAGLPRRVRVLPPALVASVVRVVLTHDGVLPEQITTEVADVLTAGCAQILMTLGVQPGNTGSLADWPVIAQIIDAAPLPVPYEQWGRS